MMKSNKLMQKGFIKFQLPPIRIDKNDFLRKNNSRNSPLDVEYNKIDVSVSEAKKKLDDIPMRNFNELMRNLDLYFGLKKMLHSEYNMQIVTNASIKMYEIITQMNLFNGFEKICAFCDAELPGAFIVAINHYVKTRLPLSINFKWVASSYYPIDAANDGDETILEDYYGIYSNNRDKWLMGPRPNAMPEDMPNISGNLLDAATVAAIGDGVHKYFNSPNDPSGANLYTSDAGIDVSEDYNKQEESTAWLNFGQILAGLLSLAIGGNFVTKQYMYNSLFNRSLIALVNAHFSETYITKPLTSRPANSEIYIVCKGFRGIDHNTSMILLNRLANKPTTSINEWEPLLDPSIFIDVDNVLLRATTQIHMKQQISFINEAVNYYHKYKNDLRAIYSTLKYEHKIARNTWITNNPISKIDTKLILPMNDKM